MPRKRGDGEGTLKKRRIGGRDVWWARWYAYDAEGKQRRPEKIIGTVKEFPTKTEARARLAEIIRETTGRIEPLPSKPTFGAIWQRYVTLKTPKWSRANRMTVTAIFNHCVLPVIGDRLISELTPEPLQACLNHMAEAPVGRKTVDGKKVVARKGYSFSAMQKALRYMRATFRFAIDEELIAKDPTKRLGLPEPPRDGCERFLSLDEIRKLLAAAEGRERLILRLLILCGLRPGELFALRTNDIEPGRLRIDEGVKEKEKQGPMRIGKPKTSDANAFVAISGDLERELRTWASTCRENGLLFPTAKGTTWRIGNYLKRVAKPLAASVGIHDLTHQALRRTFATHFQRYGSVKDTQSQLRHSDPETTLRWYQKELPDSVRDGVERFDAVIEEKVN